MDKRKRVIDVKVVAAMEACVAHARALLESARATQTAGHPNIAYHLATLTLEEIGRRALIGVQSIADKATVPPTWPKKHQQDHVKKLFWCFFGGNFFLEQITAEKLKEMSGIAQQIHENRLLGLYVDNAEDGLGIPSETITPEQAENLIKLAEARLGMIEAEKVRDEIPQDEIDQQAWFLTAADDPEKRRQIFSKGSLAKLAELKNAHAWGRWLKGLFDQAEAEGRQAAERELERSRNFPHEKTKDKWKVRVRIICASHSIRPKALTTWNNVSSWIKLSGVSGKKNELLIDFILGDNVPVQGLWWFCWGVARQFVVALNIGTMGFWWWHMPEQISRYYESIHDLESGDAVRVERSPSLKIDWGENRVLTDQDLAQVAACFAAFPGPGKRDKPGALDLYIGGLTFLALNDIHWQCEVQSFGNFFESLRAMMEQHGDWQAGTPYESAFVRFLDELFPNMDEKERYAELCRAFERAPIDKITVTLKEVSFIKLFCDAYFLTKIRPKAIKELQADVAETPDAEPTDPSHSSDNDSA